MSVETAVILWGDRHLPWEATVQQAQALLASGVVDYAEVSDQTVGFVPPSLWNEKNTSMAAVMKDPDSLDDGVITATIAAASAPGLGVTLGTDCIRTPPVEFVQTMWTLAKLTKGKALFNIGAGEVKQCAPYGHKRSTGIKRMEDLCKIYNLLWDSDGPIDFEGNHITLKGAYLGSAKPYRPEMWALGGGPQLMGLATSYLDGVAVAAPNVWTNPEEAAAGIKKLKDDVERKGRDPEKFRIGMWNAVLLHDDVEAMDKALDNPLTRWQAAVFGRISPQDWVKEGIEPAVPKGWTYFQNMKPLSIEQSFVDEVLSKASRAMAEKAFVHGSPKDVASQLQGYIDAGVQWVLPVDYMPIVTTLEDAPNCLGRSIELCGHLKGQAPKPAEL
jgi:phthiodiolone/phenolphthiodiolone dimycocerosates ketoreductase